MKNIPVILIHNGKDDYLNFSINMAAKNNHVILLGSDKFKNCEFFEFKNYFDQVDEFQKKYVHLNTTPFDYELFCFARWFILKNYMLAKKLETIFYIDSDVLFFGNTNDEYEKFEQYDMTLLHRSAAISSFISYNCVDNFCKLLIDTYTNKNSYSFKKIASHFYVRKDCNLKGGVCDMTFLDYFHYDDSIGGGPGRIGEMMSIINNCTYDHNINASDNDYAMNSRIKKITESEKKAFIFNNKLNKNIEFKSLHFQGAAKSLMQYYYNIFI